MKIEKNNTGLLFPNTKKKTENHPNLRGAALIEGKVIRVDAWGNMSNDNKKYLSTDLLKEEDTAEDHLSSNVELVSYRSFKRVCFTCCDPENCVEKNYTGDPALRLPHCARRE